MVGVMAVLIALALMTGLQGELRDRIVGSSAHVYVFKLGGDGLRDIPARGREDEDHPASHRRGAGDDRQGAALGRRQSAPRSTIKGIDPALEADGHRHQASRCTPAASTRSARPPTKWTASSSAPISRRRSSVKQGDTVRLTTPDEILTPMGMSPLRTRVFKVVGIFSLGLFEFDSEYALVDLPVAEHLFGQDQPQFLQLRLDDMFASTDVATAIPKRLGDEYITQDWKQMNKSLFSALWLEKMAISITIGLIMTVAAVNIVASLVLLVMEKSRDIAILKTMGTSTASIRRIFMLQGLIIGVAGTLPGTIGGIAIIYVLDRFKLIHVPIDVYQISYIPFTLLPTDLLTVVAAALFICFVATIYPSRQASKLDPAQALRYQ